MTEKESSEPRLGQLYRVLEDIVSACSSEGSTRLSEEIAETSALSRAGIVYLDVLINIFSDDGPLTYVGAEERLNGVPTDEFSNILQMRDIIEQDRSSTKPVSEDNTKSIILGKTTLRVLPDFFNSWVSEQIPKLADREARLALWTAIDQLRRDTDASKALSEISEARDVVFSARDAARRAVGTSQSAAGEVGSTEQASHYESYAQREKKIADRMRLGSISTLLLIAVGAFVFSLLRPSGALSLEEISKLAAVLPLAVLAAYFGRESSRHRIISNWSAELSMQLRTFDAFVAPMSDEMRSKARETLAALLFAKVERSTPKPERGPSVTNEAVKLLNAAAKIGSSSRKGQDAKE